MTARDGKGVPLTLRAEDFVLRRVQVTLTVDLAYHPEVFNGAIEGDGERNNYGFADEQDVIEHLLFNLLQGRKLSSLDGWADLPAVAAFVDNIDYLDVDALSEPREMPDYTRRLLAHDLRTWEASTGGR